MVLVYGFDKQSDAATGWLRTFDVICVATRLEEDVFHAQVNVFDGAAERVPEDVLHALSPNNTAGYYVTEPDGSRVVVMMGLTGW